eukprot:3121344-Prymnesium_polylepis.3
MHQQQRSRQQGMREPPALSGAGCCARRPTEAHTVLTGQCRRRAAPPLRGRAREQSSAPLPQEHRAPRRHRWACRPPARSTQRAWAIDAAPAEGRHATRKKYARRVQCAVCTPAPATPAAP